ncbi:porin family protein [Rhizosphaericola mali]|uniref:PorT family protein n=1 Tax=Rhizosphaericola mali TaxID=2545455 RepID=A0A5P2G0V5_9BACT|nr:porin family protein [Rhizosphaericola mali]QES87472.1 PorT family protein [Rhizosphaericola mali]
MVKKIILSALIAFGISKSYSQNNVEFGLSGSYINSTISSSSSNTTSGSTNYSSKSGFGFGAFFNLPFDKNWSIQPSLNYQRLGSNITGYFFNTSYNVNVNFTASYFTIPVLARYTFTHSDFTLLAGPQYDILLDASKNIGGSSTKIKDNFKSSGFTAVGGAEYRLPFMNKKFGIGAKYQYGLSNIVKDETNNGNKSMKNRSIVASIFYTF